MLVYIYIHTQNVIYISKNEKYQQFYLGLVCGKATRNILEINWSIFPTSEFTVWKISNIFKNLMKFWWKSRKSSNYIYSLQNRRFVKSTSQLHHYSCAFVVVAEKLVTRKKMDKIHAIKDCQNLCFAFLKLFIVASHWRDRLNWWNLWWLAYYQSMNLMFSSQSWDINLELQVRIVGYKLILHF